MTPGAFPAFCLLTAFGQATPFNLEYQRANRVLPFPFHFLSNWTLNVKPKHYSWLNFYDHVLDVTRYSFSWRAIINRFRATRAMIPQWLNLLRGLSSEGFGRIEYYTKVHQHLDTDRQVRRYFEQDTTELPQFYMEQVQKDLGPLWKWLPNGALYHDPNAYLKSGIEQSQTPLNPRTNTSSQQTEPPPHSVAGE
jgi:hypothetical protein